MTYFQSDIEANLVEDGLPGKLAELEKLAAQYRPDQVAWYVVLTLVGS